MSSGAALSLEDPASPNRPYRSHLRPACFPCRKRKSRCKTSLVSSPCAMCEFHGTDCVFPSSEQRHSESLGTRATSPGHLRKRARPSAKLDRDVVNTSEDFHSNQNLPSAPLQAPFAEPAFQTPPSLGPAIDGSVNATLPQHSDLADPNTLGETDNVHVIGPVLANDIEILETYLSAIPDTARSRLRIQTGSSGIMRPIMFTTVPRRPLGVKKDQNTASLKCEVIEKLIEPHQPEILRIYFEKANICVPLFDQASFLDLYTNHRERMSPALMSNLYANALTYWKMSHRHSALRLPDLRFIWVQANEATHAEFFQSPGIPTLMALILNVSGRPSTSPFGNGGMIGTAVALSHALGLNRDPSNWHISQAEKDMRSRIWWQVVLQDRWCSLSYGTPPQIQKSQYDVPLPTLQSLCKTEAAPKKAAAEVFIALVTLTEVLGYFLEYVYDVQKVASEVASEQSSESLERRLSSWKDSLRGEARKIIVRGNKLEISGSANLRLAYLAIELLLCRVQLDLDKSSQDVADPSSASDRQLQAQRAAEDIVNLVHILKEFQIRDFWMPASAASLTSATTYLLRSAIRSITSGDTVHGNLRLDSAIEMIQALRSHQSLYDWDIADVCVQQYGELVDKMSAMRASGSVSGDDGYVSFSMMGPDLEDFMAQSTEVSAFGLDTLFPSLWDMFDA